VYSRLHTLTVNGLIVRDGAIHWYYDRILPAFEHQGYELLVVRYDLGDVLCKELIHTRGDTETVSASRLEEIINDHKIHLKRFNAEHTADIVLNEQTYHDHARVIEALRAKLDTLAA
jgi:hypothetical protein